MPKYYEILEIDENAIPEEIKKTYRKLALKWHPDRFVSKTLEEKEEANKKMREINMAYEVLSDPEIREVYDWYGELFGNDFLSLAPLFVEKSRLEKKWGPFFNKGILIYFLLLGLYFLLIDFLKVKKKKCVIEVKQVDPDLNLKEKEKNRNYHWKWFWLDLVAGMLLLLGFFLLWSEIILGFYLLFLNYE